MCALEGERGTPAPSPQPLLLADQDHPTPPTLLLVEKPVALLQPLLLPATVRCLSTGPKETNDPTANPEAVR